MKKILLLNLGLVLVIVREIIKEVKFLIKNPLCIVILFTLTGIIPAVICGILFKILGF